MIKTKLLIIALSISLAWTVEASFSSGFLELRALYYDNGKIEVEDVVDVIPHTQEFIPPTTKNYAFYSAELYDSVGNLLISSKIDQKNEFGSDKFWPPVSAEEGYITITTPFDKEAVKIIIKDTQGQIVLEIPLENQYFCNSNGICEPQLNENSSICSVDCQPAPTVDNTSPSPSEIPVVTRSTWKIFLPLVIWFGLAIVAGIIWFTIRRRPPTY